MASLNNGGWEVESENPQMTAMEILQFVREEVGVALCPALVPPFQQIHRVVHLPKDLVAPHLEVLTPFLSSNVIKTSVPVTPVIRDINCRFQDYPNGIPFLGVTSAF